MFHLFVEFQKYLGKNVKFAKFCGFFKIKISGYVIKPPTHPPTMTTPTPPAMPAYPYPGVYPMASLGLDHLHYGGYGSGYGGYGGNNDLQNYILQSATNQNVTESARNLTHDIGQLDRNLTQTVQGVGQNVSNGVGAVKDVLYAATTGVRDLVSGSASSTKDAVDRSGLAVNSTLTSMEQSSADRGRDILQAIERTNGEARYSSAVLSAADRQAANDTARDIIAQTNRNTNEIVSGVSTVGAAGAASARDLAAAIERTSGEARFNNAVSSAADRQAANDLARDIISQSNRNTNEIVMGVSTAASAAALSSRDIVSAVEKNAGESRYTTAVTGAADRQMMGDLARDGIAQYHRGTTDILTSVAAANVAGLLATNNNGHEVKGLINHASAGILSAGSAQYSSLLLENQKTLLESYKMKEVLAAQMAESKYEALKNKETLAAQIAECCCETKMEALKNTERLSAQMAASSADTKYEALKNTQSLQSQMAECCCEIKEKVGHVYNKLDDTVRVLDGNRVRDALAVATNEINLLKAVDYASRRRSPERRYRDRSPDRR